MCIRDRCRCVLHEECAPCISTVVFQTSGILAAQRVDDGPHISLMRFQFRHCRGEIYSSGRTEQAMASVLLHTRAGSNVPVSYTHLDVYKRQVREIGGAFLIHAPVQRIHHARHAGADGAVPVNVAAVPCAVHKAGIHRLRHLPERKGCGDVYKRQASMTRASKSAASPSRTSCGWCFARQWRPARLSPSTATA